MPPTRDSVKRSESQGKEKRKPVRRDTEKRRQQNIQAQRKYREKRRKQLDYLEGLAALTTESCTAENTPATDTAHGSTRTTALAVYDTSDGPAAAHGEFQHLISPFDDTTSALSIYGHTTHVPHLDNPPTLNIWDSTLIDPSLLIRDNENDSLSPSQTTTINCGCSRPHFQIQTRGPNPFNCGELKIIRSEPGVPLPDPYANNLRIDTVCTTAALYTIGMQVGIPEEMLCADESVSPFFRPTTGADSAARTNMICTVQKIFKTLKPDLRPSSEQITVQHHPYIDILPFPTLRKNLIAHQGEIDEDEFFLDLLNGLVCWGGAGVGKRDREESTGCASTGTPWDVRSWEARTWFLKKYWTWLGGEDGELTRQTEWWRSIRGDYTLDIEVLSG